MSNHPTRPVQMSVFIGKEACRVVLTLQVLTCYNAPMDITFNRSSCGQSLTIEQAGAGSTVDCPKCGKPFTFRPTMFKCRRHLWHPDQFQRHLYRTILHHDL